MQREELEAPSVFILLGQFSKNKLTSKLTNKKKRERERKRKEQ